MSSPSVSGVEKLGSPRTSSCMRLGQQAAPRRAGSVEQARLREHERRARHHDLPRDLHELGARHGLGLEPELHAAEELARVLGHDHRAVAARREVGGHRDGRHVRPLRVREHRLDAGGEGLERGERRRPRRSGARDGHDRVREVHRLREQRRDVRACSAGRSGRAGASRRRSRGRSTRADGQRRRGLRGGCARRRRRDRRADRAREQRRGVATRGVALAGPRRW